MMFNYRKQQENQGSAEIKYDTKAALEAARDVRIHYQSTGVAFSIPALVAAGTILFVALTAGTIALLIEVFWSHASFVQAIITSSAWALGIGVPAGAAAWFALGIDRIRLIWFIERQLHVDLDGNHQVGAPVKTVKVEFRNADTGRIAFAWLPISPQAAAELARGLLSGIPLAERKWTTGPNKLLSSPEFRALQDEMILRGLAYWLSTKDHRVGAGLTGPGRAVMRRLASPTPDTIDG